MEIRVGCTGWSYDAWQGTFYPKHLQKSDWLKHYSKIFDVIEANVSFYRIIAKSMAQKWNHDTPDNFRFSLKFPQKVTHDYRLDYNNSKRDLRIFFSGLQPLRKKISVLVLQLPPSLKFQEAKKQLVELSKHFPSYYRYAIEGRHESWFSKEALDFLSELNYCLVWSEVPMVKNPAPITTDFIYMRLIGDRELPNDVYDHTVRDQSDSIKKWAERLKKLKQKDEMKFAFALTNNHLEGFAPSSANTMRKFLGLDELSFKDNSQKTLD